VSVDALKKVMQEVSDGSITGAEAIKKLEEEKVKGNTILQDVKKKVF
jgi:hypothetical protein